MTTIYMGYRSHIEKKLREEGTWTDEELTIIEDIDKPFFEDQTFYKRKCLKCDKKIMTNHRFLFMCIKCRKKNLGGDNED